MRLSNRILDGKADEANADHEVPSSPTRLVDMGSMAMGQVKVVEPREYDQQMTGRYVTLSHCWYV
jgi:hypothetical protein